MRNCEIFQKLMRFHKTNDISQNFSGIILCFCSVAMYFVDFQFSFRYFQKMTAKFHISFEQIRNFKVSNLVMAKVEKVNMAVTYFQK